MNETKFLQTTVENLLPGDLIIDAWSTRKLSLIVSVIHSVRWVIGTVTQTEPCYKVQSLFGERIESKVIDQLKGQVFTIVARLQNTE